MADVVSPEVRSRMMSGIRGKNTRPEIILRKALHAEGFRFRIHASLPGKPDMVFPKWKAVLFVHGCFWHGHKCHLFKWPKTRTEFWLAKISGNIARDERNIAALLDNGWRVGIVWECALKGRTRLDSDLVIKRCSTWLKSNKKRFELAGDEECAGVSSPTTLKG
ncbi:very short patch repair endonuclease [Tardiphaga sp. 768_D3_N2_1]|uniref:very short patch repair endonuclease n=1 Tax=Tardiphaga sp. 768_D3_N2_1 TaxID=3240783 RepID=UPI003F8C4F51